MVFITASGDRPGVDLLPWHFLFALFPWHSREVMGCELELLSISVCARLSVCAPYAQVPTEDRGHKIPGSGVPGAYEPSHVCVLCKGSKRSVSCLPDSPPAFL